MNKTTEALELAEEAAEFARNMCLGMNWSTDLPDEALAAIREARVEQEKQEPVAWHDKIKGMEVSVDVSTGEDDAHHRVMVEFTNEQYLELSKIVDITIANEYCHLNGEELKNAWLIEYGKSVYARAWLDGHDCAMNENEAAIKNHPAYFVGRAEALEEAKKTCDEICQKAIDSGYTVKGETFIDGFGDGACACVAAIRGLK